MNIGKVQIKNRIVMSPMMLGFGTFNGTATPAMLDYYEERAKGGAGLIITEITRVNDVTGASSFNQLAASHDYHIDSLSHLAQRIHRHGTKLFVQLHHPGRQNLGLMIGTVPLSIGMDKAFSFYGDLLFKIVPAGKKLQEKHFVPRVVSPSKCENSYFSDCINRGLKPSEIKRLIEQFIEGAVRVKKAGCDGVELHAAHGYLIQQFLSPNTNRRTDEYGGSFDKRMKFLLDIIKGIRRECGPDFPIVVRLSVDECYEMIGQKGKGYTLEDGVKMAKVLEKAGIDAIDVSSAAYDTFNYWLEPTTFACGWRKYMAEAVKKEVSIPVLAANLIRSAEQAEEQLESGIQDFVSLGRPMIADPYWAEKVREGREEDVKRCICCLYCFESMQKNAYKGTHARCSVNPMLGRETVKLPENGDGRTVVVIGAGVAGLTAAELLAKRGFHIVVLEKGKEPGGQLQLANKPPHKEKISWCFEDLVTSVNKLGVEIRYQTEINKEIIGWFHPYAVIVATGACALRPKSIEGADLENVCTVTEILNGSVSLTGKKVAVIGSGMTGLETSELLCEQGNTVTVIEMADTVAPGAWMQNVDDLLPKLKAKSTEFLTAHKLLKITPSAVVLEDLKTNTVKELPCDHVVLSLGVRSENRLFDELKEEYKNLFVVGDAKKTGRIADATESAYQTAAAIQ